MVCPPAPTLHAAGACRAPFKGVLRMVPCSAVSGAIQGAEVCVSAACPVGSYLTGFGCQVTRGHATGFYVSDATGSDKPTGPLAQVICTAKSTSDYKLAHIWAAAICQPGC